MSLVKILELLAEYTMVGTVIVTIHTPLLFIHQTPPRPKIIYCEKTIAFFSGVKEYQFQFTAKVMPA
ncbi:hypothetical protein LZ554_002280 [Drepanopeziza brunnea f. sp. 'monogermtubi']|nr:hypothetical protein LZ554_002280 [Drepanopeziza brunnea f. sp. 'monogermtubi']